MEQSGHSAGEKVGCQSCWAEEAAVAWQRVLRVPIEGYLIDQSHYIVSIRNCSDCAQIYLQVMTETVDWQDGDDPSYRTVVPITGEDRAYLVFMSPPPKQMMEAMCRGRKSLQCDSPKGAESTVFWGEGLRIGPHD